MMNKIALILVIVGALNWGLVGFFDYNLITHVFGSSSGLTRVIYDLIGLSGLYLAFMGKRR